MKNFQNINKQIKIYKTLVLLILFFVSDCHIINLMIILFANSFNNLLNVLFILCSFHGSPIHIVVSTSISSISIIVYLFDVVILSEWLQLISFNH